MTANFLAKNASVFGSSSALISKDIYFTYAKVHEEVCKRADELNSVFDLQDEYTGKVAII
ncbi:hypothetical protein ACRPOS_000135 [Bartonella heixiaziensis]|uniref:hypothetical protein n=1 Tax=Bartonella heixiaziensis TaxID=1461000 RepID=UPI0039088C45